MLGLGKTTAELARFRQQWEQHLSAAAARGSGDGSDEKPGRLTEVRGFGSNPGNLRMLVHVPDLLPPSPALVVVLHGCKQTAAGYDHGTGWSALGDRHGFVVLTPEQKRQNNANKCFNWFEPGDTSRGQGEALSIRQMVERASIDHGVDPRRIFITGLSAGGAMTSVMLATYPEVFAGGAIIAGLPYGCASSVQEAFQSMFNGQVRLAREWGDLVRAASPHKGPWPKLSVWHGGADATVTPINAEEIIKQWTDLHGLPQRPTLEMQVDGYPQRVWRDRRGNGVIEAFMIPRMAHGTPIHPGGDAEGRCGTAAPYILDVGISSTHHIAKFWNLIDRGAAANAARQSPAPTDDPGPQNRQTYSGSGRVNGGSGLQAPDPKSIIIRALRAAGLLKNSGDQQ